MLVEQVMSSPVLSVAPTTSIDDAARLMLAHHISGLPVTTPDGVLVGIVSEGDFLRRGELGTKRKRSRWLEFFMSPGKAAEEYVQANTRRVGDVMTTEVATTRPDAPLEEVVEAMSRYRVKRLPVLKDGKLLGIVSRSDLLRALVRSRADAPAEAVSDAVIRDAIAARFAEQSWSGNGLIRAHVEQGTVELTGTLFDERERQAARVLAENVEGVKSVIDHLVSVEPLSGVIIMPPSETSEPTA